MAECDNGDRTHTVNTFRASAMLQGQGDTTNVGNDRERWCDLKTEEEYIGVIVWAPQVCDYQGSIHVYHPNGDSAGRSNTSSYHSGCSWNGWFFHDALDGEYAENKRFTTKWRSDATSDEWNVIGTLVD